MASLFIYTLRIHLWLMSYLETGSHHVKRPGEDRHMDLQLARGPKVCLEQCKLKRKSGDQVLLPLHRVSVRKQKSSSLYTYRANLEKVLSLEIQLPETSRESPRT